MLFSAACTSFGGPAKFAHRPVSRQYVRPPVFSEARQPEDTARDLMPGGFIFLRDRMTLVRPQSSTSFAQEPYVTG